MNYPKLFQFTFVENSITYEYFNFSKSSMESYRQSVESNGIEVEKINDVLIQKLHQEIPGQLGKICRLMAENKVQILTQYSDHDNQLILVVDDFLKGKQLSEKWKAGFYD